MNSFASSAPLYDPRVRRALTAAMRASCNSLSISMACATALSEGVILPLDFFFLARRAALAASFFSSFSDLGLALSSCGIAAFVSVVCIGADGDSNVIAAMGLPVSSNFVDSNVTGGTEPAESAYFVDLNFTGAALAVTLVVGALEGGLP